MKTITEQTLIPLGVAFLVIGSGGIWIASMEAKVRANDEKKQKAYLDNESVARHIERIANAVQDIRERTIRIEMKINREKNKWNQD